MKFRKREFETDFLKCVTKLSKQIAFFSVGYQTDVELLPAGLWHFIYIRERGLRACWVVENTDANSQISP